jgi:hypothetical protein
MLGRSLEEHADVGCLSGCDERLGGFTTVPLGNKACKGRVVWSLSCVCRHPLCGVVGQV